MPGASERLARLRDLESRFREVAGQQIALRHQGWRQSAVYLWGRSGQERQDALVTAIREFAEQRRQPDTSRLPEEWLNGVSAALRAEKPAVRVEACRVLGLYGSQAYRLRQTLVPLLQQDSDPQVRAAAARALLRITPPTD